jgi:uncharacterized protein YjiS (DUF1127 family)
MCIQVVQAAVLTDQSPGEEVLPERRALSAYLETVAVWIVRSGQRKALRDLAQEGRLLSDIGLTREQALREAAKPFWRQ